MSLFYPHCHVRSTHLNPETEQILLKALSKNPQDRYQAVKSFANPGTGTNLPDDQPPAPQHRRTTLEACSLSNLTVLDLIAFALIRRQSCCPKDLFNLPSVEVGQSELRDHGGPGRYGSASCC
jgi:hypothetical protein